MKILILHHVEEMWESGFLSYGTSFEEVVQNILDHIENSEYDQIILTRFEDHELGIEHHKSGLSAYVDKVYPYMYGWEKSEVENNPHVKWVDGGSHSEVVPIDDWMEDLHDHDVDLCGAFDGECIEDMEMALNGIGVRFNRLESLII